MNPKIIKIVILVYLITGVPTGLLFCMLGRILMRQLDKCVETKAVISEIIKEPDQLSHQTFVTYTVDEVTYTEKLNVTSFKDYVGREVTVFYMPSKPQRIFGDSRLIFQFMIYSGAYVCVISAVGTIILLIVFNRMKKATPA